MQILLMVAFLIIWLAVLWGGSIALEATGLERRKARFQALSALTNSGFTTREAESVVDNPGRRRIIFWLILLGNIGVASFLITLIIALRSGFEQPSARIIIFILVALLVIVLTIWLGIIGRLTGSIVTLLRKENTDKSPMREEVLYDADGYGLVRFTVGSKAAEGNISVSNTGLSERGLAVLAIERKDKVLPFPAAEEKLLPGDQILCYGECKR